MLTGNKKNCSERIFKPKMQHNDDWILNKTIFNKKLLVKYKYYFSLP